MHKLCIYLNAVVSNEKLCNERKYLDKIFLPKLYEFNASYASSHTSIKLKIDGHLTNFEFELLDKCCQYTQVELIFNTSRFNTKMKSRFSQFGIELEAGYEYHLSLNDKTIISSQKIEQNKALRQPEKY